MTIFIIIIAHTIKFWFFFVYILEVPVPRFEGIDIEPYEKSGQIITDEDREKYKDMFYKLNPINGILEGISVF